MNAGPIPPPLFPPLPPPQPVQVSGSDDKLWSVFSHLSILFGVGILLPLVVYLVKKDDSPAAAFHSREALNFHLCVILYSFLCIPLIFVLVGIPLLILLGFGSLVLSIVAAIRASEGKEYRYPLTLRFVR